MGGGIWSTIGLIAVMILVLVAAFYTTKFLSIKTKNLTSGKYLQVKDRMLVGMDKHIVLLEVGEKAFLVGITNQTINVIGELPKEEITPLVEEKQPPNLFAAVPGVSGIAASLLKKFGTMKSRPQTPSPLPKKRINVQSGPKDEESEDIERLFTAINQRKSRFLDITEKKGDQK